ncbi:hypothetical protein AVEN_107873-2-1, partial [Araneus ventricosus]
SAKQTAVTTRTSINRTATALAIYGKQGLFLTLRHRKCADKMSIAFEESRLYLFVLSCMCCK